MRGERGEYVGGLRLFKIFDFWHLIFVSVKVDHSARYKMNEMDREGKDFTNFSSFRSSIKLSIIQASMHRK